MPGWFKSICFNYFFGTGGRLCRGWHCFPLKRTSRVAPAIPYWRGIVLPFCPTKVTKPSSHQSCHPCSHCPRVFPTAGRRSRHEATHDGDDGEELHSCPHCGEQQPSRLVLNMHTRYLKHSNRSNKEHEQLSKFDIFCARYCRARDEEYTVVVEEERVELGGQSMVLTLEKDDLLVYQMNQQ